MIQLWSLQEGKVTSSCPVLIKKHCYLICQILSTKKLFLQSHLGKGMIMDLKMHITPPSQLRKAQETWMQAKFTQTENSTPDVYLMHTTHALECVYIYIYSIKPHSFPAALLVSGKLKNNLQKWHNALPNQWELQVLQHSSMVTVMWENIFRLLPGGAVLCMSQFSKSIKVMQLLDQQMNTKGKKWQNRLREKHKGHEKRSSWKDWREHSASQR